MTTERSLHHAALFFLVLVLAVSAVNVTYLAKKKAAQHKTVAPETSATVSFEEESADTLHSDIIGSNDFLDMLYLDFFYSYIPHTDDAFHQQQGACTDGTHIWAGWSSPYELLQVGFITLQDSSVPFKEKEWKLGHVNDLTYNPDSNRIYVCAYQEEEYRYSGDIAVLDPETLQPETVIHLRRNGEMCPVHGIAYDRIHRQYITATRDSGGRDYAIFDENFEYLHTIRTERNEGYVLQGIETDGCYLYRALCDTAGNNHIAVYDFDGQFIRLITVPVSGAELELEDIFYDWHGNWFLNFSDHKNSSGGCTIAYAGLQQNADYKQVSQFYGAFRKFLLSNA